MRCPPVAVGAAVAAAAVGVVVVVAAAAAAAAVVVAPVTAAVVRGGEMSWLIEKNAFRTDGQILFLVMRGRI